MKKLVFSVFVTIVSTVTFSQCNELFFSEYLEGSSNNKAMEIYNPTSNAIDLSNYVVYRANNGSVIYSDSLHPVGLLAPGDVYVMGNPSADPIILGVADTLHTITFYNGDDAMLLKNKTTNQIIDVIGQLGVDPGVNWPVGSGATSEFTLIRKITIQGGEPNWAIAANEYDVYPQNMMDSLGMHSMNPCGTSCVNTSSSISATECDTYTAPDGAIYTSTGIYSATISNAAGCDSVITINLTINNSTVNSISASACGSYTLNTITYTNSGTYTQSLSNSIGCDSTIVLTLDITPTPLAPLVIGDTMYCEGEVPTALEIAVSSTDSLIITGVLDATLAGGLPKVIEFYALEDISDLSSYGFGSANNGGGTDGEEFTFPAVSVVAGTYIHVSTDSANVFAFLGFYPDYVHASAGNVNGDDAIELFHNGVVIDVFGDINVDGTGQPWEYMDGWAYRKNNTAPNGGVFNIGEWEFSGIDVLDGAVNNASSAAPFPYDTYTYAPYPTTYTWYSDANLSTVLATGTTYTPATTTGATSYYVTTTNSGTTTCEGPATIVNVSINALPTVTFGALSTVCVYDAVVTLNQASPAGGTYSGTGVSGNSFDPAVAGVGSHVITYNYTDVNGCSGDATSTIVVDGCAGINELNLESLVVYPNPANNMIHVSGVDHIEELQVVDMSGTIITAEKSSSISVEGLANGMYLVRIVSDNGITTRSFVKN